jgi:hypothetical protein
MSGHIKPHGVQLTGENSFIRLHSGQGGPLTTRASHWRVLLSPGGPGHVLYFKSDVTNDEVRIYSDNIMLARWLQAQIETRLFPEFGNESIPVVDGLFSKSGDGQSFWTETIETDEETIALTWYDFVDPIMLRTQEGTRPGNPWGVYTCFVPAKRAQITLNGAVAKGIALPEQRGPSASSTACLAWSETWLLP